MGISIPASVALCLSEVESNVLSWIGDHEFSAELDAQVPNAALLTDDERCGCFAEIVVHRFASTTSPTGGHGTRILAR
jgi:hypothetical protein